jgi:hypothetical protein
VPWPEEKRSSVGKVREGGDASRRARAECRICLEHEHILPVKVAPETFRLEEVRIAISIHIVDIKLEQFHATLRGCARGQWMR